MSAPAERVGMRLEPAVSVLMSTYRKESAANLAASLASLYGQTLVPAHVVLVVDGPVPADQEDVIASFAARPGPELEVVRLAENGGLARAMNAGLPRCRGEWVVRHDSDDVCQPDRLEVQMAYLRDNPGTDVLSSWCEDFYDDGAPSHVKVSPTGHEAVVAALRWRNVIAHTTLVVRASRLRAVGGYRPDFGLLEDYDLFVRLALAGARFHVIPKALVRMRCSTAQKERRGGLGYCLCELRFRLACHRAGFLSLGQLASVTPLYLVFRLLSGRAKRGLYRLART